MANINKAIKIRIDFAQAAIDATLAFAQALAEGAPVAEAAAALAERLDAANWEPVLADGGVVGPRFGDAFHLRDDETRMVSPGARRPPFVPTMRHGPDVPVECKTEIVLAGVQPPACRPIVRRSGRMAASQPSKVETD